MKSPSVIVLGLYLPGIDILRNFRSRAIPCMGMDCSDNSPGFGLRKVPVLLCPDPEKEEQAWLAFMLGYAGKSDQKPALLITSDKFILPVLRNAAILDPYFLFHHSENGITEKLMNKRSLVETALLSGVPVPRTLLLDESAAINILPGSIGFPCLVRPEFSKKWMQDPLKQIVKGNKLIRCANQDELDDWLAKITPHDKELIIQEMIPGPDENLFYLVVYIDRNHKCTGYFCGQKLRITPIHFGSASYMRTTDADALLPAALALLEKNGYHGPAGVEFKKDQRDGSSKLIEINTRFGLWDVMGGKLGVDLFYQAYCDLAGMEVVPVEPEKTRYYWLSVSRDFSNWIEYRKEGLLTFPQWISSFFGKVYLADLYPDEPGIFYRLYLKRIIKKIKKIFLRQ